MNPLITARNLSKAFAAALLLSASTASANFYVYVSQPGELTSSLAGVVTEDFEGITPNPAIEWALPSYTSTGIGTYVQSGSNTSVVQGDDQYGSGTGQYMFIRVGGSVTLSLDNGAGATSAQYFGFSWSAGDGQNQVTVQNDGSDIFTLTTQTIIDFLPNNPTSTVTAINSNVYNTEDYYGKPGTGENGGEEYAYIHILATGGSVFDAIVLEQISGGNFENDNHSILFGSTPTVDGDWVLAVSVPEPSTYALLAGILALSWVACSRRSRS
jgi:hypothetical protein